ncbi:MAG: hypothetical protein NVS4B3_07020 [Gemmatimonadaceae bacterium]
MEPMIRYRLLITVIASAILNPRSPLAAQTPDAPLPVDSTERELLALTTRNARMAVPYDRRWADSTLGDDYVSINGSGLIGDKAGAMRMYTTGVIKLDTSTVTDLHARVYGTTGVVTGVWQFAGLNYGSRRSGRLRFTAVWVRRNGRWQEVSWQGTPISVSPPAPAAAVRSTPSGGSRTIGELAQLDWKRFLAVQRRDVRGLDTLLADDWLASSGTAQPLTKRQYLDQLTDGRRLFGDIVHDDVHVRLYGDAAIITGRATGPYRIDGREMSTRGRFTHVYVRRDDRWLMVGMHNSNAPIDTQRPPAPARAIDSILLATTTDDVGRHILRMEQRKAELLTHPDRAFADSTLADDYVAINSAGNVGDKAEAIRLYGTGVIDLASSQLSDLRVRVYDRTAVVTGIWDIVGSHHGTPGAGHMRFTRVWVKNGGRWQSVSWQGTEITSPVTHGTGASNSSASTTSR